MHTLCQPKYTGSDPSADLVDEIHKMTRTTAANTHHTNDQSATTTVKPFNLAALKVDDFAFKIILVPFILANSSRTIPTHE